MYMIKMGNVAICLYVDGTDSVKREKLMIQIKEGQLQK